MKKIFVSLIALVVFFGTAPYSNAAGNKRRYVESKGRFSISIPDTWQLVKVKEFRYKILRGAFENNFAPTINFIDEAFTGQFDEYIEHINEELGKIYGENMEYILQSPFTTDKGLKGEIIVITTYQQERLIQQSFFCFPGDKGKNIIITCTNLAEKNARFSELFINTVKSFEWL